MEARKNENEETQQWIARLLRAAKLLGPPFAEQVEALAVEARTRPYDSPDEFFAVDNLLREKAHNCEKLFGTWVTMPIRGFVDGTVLERPPLELLARVAGGCTILKGFDETSMENAPGKIMLVVTELDEAIEAIEQELVAPRNAPRPAIESWQVELSDAAIRILEIGHHWFRGEVGPMAWSRIEARSMTHGAGRGIFKDPEVIMWPVVRYLCGAVEEWRNENTLQSRIALELALLELFRIADRCGFDLTGPITTKMIRNSQRPGTHGRKRRL